MYINTARVLENKGPNSITLNKKFDILKRNDTPTNRLKFNNYFRSLPDNIALENIHCLYEMMGGYDTFIKKSVNECGNVIINHGNIIVNHQKDNIDNSDMIMNLMSRYYMSGDDIQDQKDELDEYIGKLKKSPLKNNNAINNLKDISDKMEKLVEERNSTEYLREDTLNRLNIERFTEEDYNSTASYLAHDIGLVVNNINHNPEVISHYEKTLRNIASDKSKDVFVQLPYVLKANGDLVLSVTVTSIGQSSINLICSVPELIVNKILKMNLSKAQYNAYIKIMDIEISRMYKNINSGDPRQYNLYMQYLDALKYAKGSLIKYSQRKNYNVNENLACMQPSPFMYEECVFEDVTADLEENIVNLVFNDDDEIDDETMENFSKLCHTYESLYNLLYVHNADVLEEAGKISSAAMRVSHKANKVARKSTHAIQKKKSLLDRVKAPIKKVTDPVANFISGRITKIKEMDKEQRRRRIIDGTLRSKIYMILRKAVGIWGKATAGGIIGGILFGGAGAVIGSGLVGLISMITAVAKERSLSNKERAKIVHELETELKIVEEKIDDAKGDGNKEAKYQLIRIKNTLEKDIERIKFRLK